jgi:hypothetical protein
MQHYIQPNQVDNYFSNEAGGAKTTFAKKTVKINNIDLFKGFIILFKEIDRITGIRDGIYYKE